MKRTEVLIDGSERDCSYERNDDRSCAATGREADPTTPWPALGHDVGWGEGDPDAGLELPLGPCGAPGLGTLRSGTVSGLHMKR